MADTLTKKELKRLTKENTELKNRKPIYVEKIKLVPQYIEKEIDGVVVKNDSIKIKDYYPNKQNSFLEYSNRLSVLTQKGFSQFKFNPIDIRVIMTQRKDGLFEADIKVPDYIKISNVDIQSQPFTPQKIDKIGILFGANYGKNLDSKEYFLDIDTYLRINKFYLGGGINTKGDMKAGFKIEF